MVDCDTTVEKKERTIIVCLVKYDTSFKRKDSKIVYYIIFILLLLHNRYLYHYLYS